MEKKQTAVEWLMPNVLGLMLQLSNKKISQRACELKVIELIEQAKEMEKEQIIDAFGIGCHHESKRLVGYQDVAEQYYNETYRK